MRRDNINKKKVYFHRVLMGEPDGFVIDHINGNQADNRRCNLRVCTHQQNARNRKQRIDSNSRYKGVSREGDGWRYFIWDGGRQVGKSGFATEEDAAIAYNEHALSIFGEFARLNAIFPNGRPATRSAIDHPDLRRTDGGYQKREEAY